MKPFLVFVMCTRRQRIPTLSKRIHERPTTSGFRFNIDLYGDLDQRCDRRVESDPLTLNPMATANQTSVGVGSVGDGRLCMRRPARDDHIWNKPEKTKCQRLLGPWGVKEPLLSWHILVLDRHGAQMWN